MRKIFFKLYIFFCQTVNSRYWKNEVHLGIWRASVSVKVCACVSVRGTVQVGPNCEKGAKASWASVQCPLGPAELKEWGISSNPNKEKNLSGKVKGEEKKGLEVEHPVTHQMVEPWSPRPKCRKGFELLCPNPRTTLSALAQDLPAFRWNRHNQTQKQ